MHYSLVLWEVPEGRRPAVNQYNYARAPTSLLYNGHDGDDHACDHHVGHHGDHGDDHDDHHGGFPPWW